MVHQQPFSLGSCQAEQAWPLRLAGARLQNMGLSSRVLASISGVKAGAPGAGDQASSASGRLMLCTSLISR